MAASLQKLPRMSLGACSLHTIRPIAVTETHHCREVARKLHVRLHKLFPLKRECSSLSSPSCFKHTKIEDGRPEAFGVLMLTNGVRQIDIVVF